MRAAHLYVIGIACGFAAATIAVNRLIVADALDEAAAWIRSVVPPARGETRDLYDQYGLRRGSVDYSGRRATVRDQYGHVRGRYERNRDGSITHYDANGHVTGRESAPRKGY